VHTALELEPDERSTSMTQQSGQYASKPDERNGVAEQTIDRTRELADEALDRADEWLKPTGGSRSRNARLPSSPWSVGWPLPPVLRSGCTKLIGGPKTYKWVHQGWTSSASSSLSHPVASGTSTDNGAAKRSRCLRIQRVISDTQRYRVAVASMLYATLRRPVGCQRGRWCGTQPVPEKQRCA
jgi:hypothetical protein